jgi:hypothetical protein
MISGGHLSRRLTGSKTGGVSLWGDDNAVITHLFFTPNFWFTRKMDGSDIIHTLASIPNERHTNLTVRYWRTCSSGDAAGTIDVAIDGRLVLEGHRARTAAPFKEVKFHVGGGGWLSIDRVKIRAGNAPTRPDLNTGLPVITTDDLHLRFIRHMPLASRNVVLVDLDGDGQAELASGDDDRRGSLQVYRFTGRELDIDLLAARQFRSSRYLLAVTSVDNRLAVFGLESPPRAESDGTANGAFGLLSLNSDNQLDWDFAWSHEDHLTSGDSVGVTFSGGHKGFVLAGREYLRGFVIFQSSTGMFQDLYEQKGLYQPVPQEFDVSEGASDKPTAGGETPGPSDIFDIAAADWDDDGDDDLFLGWGHWSGYRPALVIMEEGKPLSPLRAQSITDGAVGITRLAISRLDEANDYLIAASERIGAAPGQGGLRVWQVKDVRSDRPTPPMCFESCDALNVATGIVAGQPVVATLVRESFGGVSRVGEDAEWRLVVRIDTLEGEGLRTRWQAEWMIPMRSFMPEVDVDFGDLNGDGEPELVVATMRDGIYIFGLDQTGVPP